MHAFNRAAENRIINQCCEKYGFKTLISLVILDFKVFILIFNASRLQCGAPLHPAMMMSRSCAYFIGKSTSQYSLTFDKTLHANMCIHRDGSQPPLLSSN